MAVAVLTVLAIAVLLGLLLLLGRREHSGVAKELRLISETPLLEARAKAESMLSSATVFKVRTASKPAPVADLPPEVARLFANYEDIVCHEFWLGHAALLEPARLPNYIKIGGDSGFAQILVRPNEETVWISYPEDAADMGTESLPSVWHKLLVAAT